jgi:hypothetical protein
MERLEAISKVTHVDIEVLKKAKMYTHSDFPKVSEERKKKALLDGSLDFWWITFKVLEDRLGPEEARAAFDKAMMEFGCAEGKKELKNLGLENDNTVRAYTKLQAAARSVFDHAYNVFELSNERAIHILWDCPAPARFAYHNCPGDACNIIDAYERGRAMAINPKLTLTNVSKLYPESRDPFCAILAEIKD